LMGVIKASLPEQVLISFYTALNEEGFWEVLGQKIYGPEADSSFEYASAFFNRLVDQCATQTNADVLFSHLIHDTRFLDGLVDSISNSPIYEQKVAAINALRAILLKSGEQLFDSALEAYAPTPVPNMLSGIQADLHSHLKTRTDILSQKLVDDSLIPARPPVEFSTFKVSSSFTVPRLHLLEVLVELAQRSPQDVLGNFTADLWKSLSDWLFEHRFNNIYHELFYKLFRTMVKINHTESLKSLLSKHKFLTRMIEHYKATSSTDSGLRSYIIQMSNYVRLTVDTLPPSEFIKSFIISHAQWKEFLPLLREDTIRQFTTDFPAPSGGHPLSVSPFAGIEGFSLFNSVAALKPITPDDVDIDLGSDYANRLGFEDASAHIDKKKKRKRRKKSKAAQAAGAEKEKDEDVEEDAGEEEEGSGDEGSEGSDDEAPHNDGDHPEETSPAKQTTSPSTPQEDEEKDKANSADVRQEDKDATQTETISAPATENHVSA